MFGRRTPTPLWRRFLNFLWPRCGFVRAAHYNGHRLARIAATPHALAIGFACGAAASFLPLVGLHFLLAALLAYALRGNLLASAIGTVVGNPWTFPLIWIGSYKLGMFLLGGYEEARLTSEELGHVFSGLIGTVRALDFAGFKQTIWPLFMPMMLGGSILGLIGGAAFYWLSLTTILRFRQKRKSRKAKLVPAGQMVAGE